MPLSGEVRKRREGTQCPTDTDISGTSVGRHSHVSVTSVGRGFPTGWAVHPHLISETNQPSAKPRYLKQEKKHC